MMNFLKKRLNQKGFTLVELLIVIAVLGIIAGIGVKSMTGVTSTFRNKADQETARMLARQIEVMVLAGTITPVNDTDVSSKIPDKPKPQTGTEYVLTMKVDSNDAKIKVTIKGNDTFNMNAIDIADTSVDKQTAPSSGGTSGGTSGGSEG